MSSVIKTPSKFKSSSMSIFHSKHLLKICLAVLGSSKNLHKSNISTFTFSILLLISNSFNSIQYLYQVAQNCSAYIVGSACSLNRRLKNALFYLNALLIFLQLFRLLQSLLLPFSLQTQNIGHMTKILQPTAYN